MELERSAKSKRDNEENIHKIQKLDLGASSCDARMDMTDGAAEEDCTEKDRLDGSVNSDRDDGQNAIVESDSSFDRDSQGGEVRDYGEEDQ